ncbi:MAG: NAD kinase [Planctomycetota bacterium]
MKISIFGNSAKPLVLELIAQSLPWLRKQAEVVKVDVTNGGPLDPEDSDVILIFGGDGTILSVARRLTHYEAPVVGINAGKLGFLAAISPQSFQKEFQRILQGQYVVSERMMLGVSGLEERDLEQGHFGLVALNEVVVERGASPRTLSIEVLHGDQYFNTVSSDGLIVATPTGSTAYSLSAGGPLVSSDLNVMIITPVCPHCLYERPFVVSADKPVRLIFEGPSPGGRVCLDGQTVFDPKTRCELEIRKFEHYLRMLTAPEVGQYEVIRSKLNWGCPYIPASLDGGSSSARSCRTDLED